MSECQSVCSLLGAHHPALCLWCTAGPSAGTSTVLCSLEATTRHAGGHCTIQAFELPDASLTHRLVSAYRACVLAWPCISVAKYFSNTDTCHRAPLRCTVQVAQTAAQPGILTCWLDLLALTSSSAEFFCAPLPAVLTGKPYVELRRWAAPQACCSTATRAPCLSVC